MSSILKKYYSDGYKAVTLGDKEIVEYYTNPEEEYKVIRNEAGILDGDLYGAIKVSGDEATEFLDSVATKDIEYLNIGSISECLFLNEDAEVLAPVFVEKFDEDYIVLVPAENEADVLAYLKEKAGEGVEISNLPETKSLVSIEGPKSWIVVKDLLHVEIENLALRNFFEIKYEDSDVSISRIGRSGEYGYVVIADTAVIEKFVESALNFDKVKCQLCGREALEICMLEIRQPNLRYESSKEGNIFELQQQWLVQYDKEDYAGCEKLKELFEEEKTSISVGFEVEGKTAVSKDAEVLLDDEAVGNVVYSKYSPNKEAAVGIAKLKADVAVAGITLKVKDADGTVYNIKTIASPFVRPISWDAKME